MAVLLPGPARADWAAPVLVSEHGYPVVSGKLCADPVTGGVISVVASSRNAHGLRYMNRVDPGGWRPLGWSGGGLGFSVDYLTIPPVTPDGSGGLWYAEMNNFTGTNGAYVQRTGGGSSVLVTSPYNHYYGLAVAADGSGGVYVGWSDSNFPGSVHLRHYQSNGALAPGWTASGLVFANGFDTPVLEADGTGGVLVLSGVVDPSNGTQSTRVWRVTAAATFPAGWTSAGLALDSSIGGIGTALLQLDATRFAAVWTVTSYPSGSSYTKERVFMLDGTLDLHWPSGGLLVPEGAQFVPDGLGALYILEQSGPTVTLRHLLTDSTYDPAFGGDAGISPLGSGAVLGDGRFPVTCVAAANGGALVSWCDVRDGTAAVRSRWLLADGSNDPNELDEGRVVLPSSPGLTPLLLAARADGAGGAFLLWTRDTSFYDPNTLNYWYDSYVTRITPGALLGVPPATAALKLAAGPNPARGALAARFTLPDARPARLELIDLSGRRLLSRDVSGAGGHSVSLGEASALPPGLYLLRLTHGGVSRTVRVALVH